MLPRLPLLALVLSLVFIISACTQTLTPVTPQPEQSKEEPQNPQTPETEEPVPAEDPKEDPEPTEEPEELELVSYQLVDLSVSGLSTANINADLSFAALEGKESSLKLASEFLSAESFILNGTRYVSLGFTLNNQTDADLSNLAFIAVDTKKSLGQTVFTNLALASGTKPTNAVLAKQIAPSHAVQLINDQAIVLESSADMQVFSQSYLNELSDQLGLLDNTLQQFGFVARSESSRTLSTSGTVYFAFSMPVSQDEVDSFNFHAYLVTDSPNSVTESLEEQANSQALLRAQALGANLNILAGSATASNNSTRFCSVRLSGKASNANNLNAYLINETEPCFSELQAINDSYTLDFAGTLESSVLSNDSGSYLSVNSNPVVAPEHGSLSLNADGSFSYTHDGSVNLQDSFSYELMSGNQRSEASVSLSVEVPQPVAIEDSYVFTHASTLAIPAVGLLANDTGILLSINPLAVNAPEHGSLSLNADGSFSYTHNGSSNFEDSFSYELISADKRAQAIVTLTSSAPAPVANNDSYTLEHAATLSVNAVGLLGNDDGLDLRLNTTAISAPQHGTLSLNANGSFSYTHDGSENLQDSFTYELLSHGQSASASVTLSINAPEIAATNDAYSVSTGSSLSIVAAGLLANDEGSNLRVNTRAVRNPEHGSLTLRADGSFTYTHDGSFTTTDSFVYEATAFGQQVRATVNLSIMATGSCNTNASQTLHNVIVDGYTEFHSYDLNDVQNVFVNSAAVNANQTMLLCTITGEIVDQISFSASPQSATTAEPWAQGFKYQQSFTYQIPAGLESGIYLWANKIPFVVKDTNRTNRVKVVFPTNTMAAYSCAGGKNTYRCGIADLTDRPDRMSFQRPLISEYGAIAADGTVIPDYGAASTPFFWWFKQNASEFGGYGVLTDYDLDDPTTFDDADVLVLPGHNEYWTRKARENVDTFVARGGHLVVLSGNTMWWQVRYEDSDNDGSDDRMIIYKNYDDPAFETNRPMTTIKWNNAHLDYPIYDSIGADFQIGGYARSVEGFPASNRGYIITEDNSPLFEGTSLQEGDLITWNHVGNIEYDGAPVTGVNAKGYPMLDYQSLGFHKLELLGYDHGHYATYGTFGTFIAFQKTASSGIVVNTASHVWAIAMVQSPEASDFQQITYNIIEKLANDKEVFSPNVWTAY